MGGSRQRSTVLEELSSTCTAEGCSRPLSGDPSMEMETDAGTRRAYECVCGAVTITVVK